MDVDSPSWEVLRGRVTRSRFSPAGAEALGAAIGDLQRLLGGSWPRRQYQGHGFWPGELNLLGFYTAALPQFLALVTRLEAVAGEPTFGSVLRALKRGVTASDWRHVLLQLEVARAVCGAGTVVTFEPAISGSTRRADRWSPGMSVRRSSSRSPPSLALQQTWIGKATKSASGRP